ncbi:hypothetical protein WYH_01258 [Croceibacterium atlanticum]|uniref:17 kDa surface antigen n=2 Tax=Croceibacterium atlanticum TaxID=1267766 RepID=A0A0F7KP53_9SPHN|nr:hypothetical protein WYH_01258 [Croceibacterium atlanticum]
MHKLFKTAALGLAATGMAASVPASAADFATPAHRAAAPVQQDWQHSRDRGRHEGWYRGRGNQNRYGRDYDYRRAGYDDRVYRDTRVWRGNDGRTYCRKSDGTTGLIVGGALGALLGREIDGGRDRTLGTILGAAGGALLGKEVDGGTRCR